MNERKKLTSNVGCRRLVTGLRQPENGVSEGRVPPTRPWLGPGAGEGTRKQGLEGLAPEGGHRDPGPREQGWQRRQVRTRPAPRPPFLAHVWPAVAPGRTALPRWPSPYEGEGGLLTPLFTAETAGRAGLGDAESPARGRAGSGGPSQQAAPFQGPRGAAPVSAQPMRSDGPSGKEGGPRGLLPGDPIMQESEPNRFRCPIWDPAVPGTPKLPAGVTSWLAKSVPRAVTP